MIPAPKLVRVLPVDFGCNWLISDVTADGWILERLSSENLRFAGPVQSLGIKLGILVGFSGFMMLESKFEWVTLPNYFFGLACAIAASVLVIIFFISETKDHEDKEDKLAELEKLSIDNDIDNLTPWTILKCLLRGTNLLLIVCFTFVQKLSSSETFKFSSP